MTIVFCLNHFMPYQIAGTEVYTWALAKSLQKRGHDVAIVVPGYKSAEFNEYEYDGLSVKRYAEPDVKDRLLIMGKRKPDGLVAFEQLIKQLKPDVVHVQELAGSSGIGIYHLRALRNLKIKVLFTMHLARYTCFSGTLMFKNEQQCSGIIDIKRCTKCALHKLPVSSITQKVLYNTSLPLYNLNIDAGKINHSLGTALSYPFIIRNLRSSLFEIVDLCEKVIVLTDWYKKVLLENGVPENKMCLVKQALPYPVSTESTQKSVTKKPISLIFIGRIDPIKGLHLLLDAIKEISEDEVTLDIFGGVNDKNYFESWKGKTEGKRNIAWKDLLPQKDVVNTIRKYDALVLPSIVGEMSPLVIQEAFAAGVPVIGSNVAGIAEQIQNKKNGLLFEFQNSSNLKDILLSLIRNPTLLNDLRNNIIHPNDFETVVDEMLKIYQTVLNPNVSVKNSGA